MADAARSESCSLQKQPPPNSPACSACLEEAKKAHDALRDERLEARDEAQGVVRRFRALRDQGETNWGHDEYEVEKIICNKDRVFFTPEECIKVRKLIGINKLANTLNKQVGEWEKVCSKK